MRLIEFLKQSAITEETPVSFVRMPLYYLGGSIQEYNNYRCTGLFESLMLNEAAISRYLPMIEVFKKIDEWFPVAQYDDAKDKLDWAMSVLKREDRITWFMRIYKAKLLNDLTNTKLLDDPMLDDRIKFITKEAKRAIGKLEKLYGSEAYVAMREIDSRTFYAHMEHTMSMNIPKAVATVWGNQMPQDLIAHFITIEHEWMAAKKSVINMDDDAEIENVETLIEFPDGWRWVNLNRSSCTIEGDAMGHCGNTATNGRTETVLSLRQPITANGKYSPDRTSNHWKPHATFILDKSTGLLGEMKGRNNQKPSDKLHKYIVPLLKLPLIKGIVGGGYKPSANFAMDDLDTGIREALIKEKPELGSLKDLVSELGFDSPIVRAKISTITDSTFTDTNKLIVDEYKNLDRFIEYNAKSHDLIRIVGNRILNDDDRYDGEYYSGDLDDRQSLATEYYGQNQDELKHLKAYVKETYPEPFGYNKDGSANDESDYDLDDIDDIITVLEEEGDDIYDQLGYAISDGHRTGAESAMYDDFWQWVDDPIDGYGELEFDNPDDKYGSPVSVVLSSQEFLYMLNEYPDDGSFIEDFNYKGWDDIIELNSFDEPNYGWDGYDNDTALLYFGDLVEIPKTDSYEIEHQGNAKPADAEWMKKKIIKQFDAEEKQLNGISGKTIITPDDTRISNIEIINGVVTMNVYPVWDNQDVKLAQHLRKISDLADERGVPVVITGFNGNGKSDLVGEAGFKEVRHGYLRYDPPVTESAIKLRGFDVGEENTGDLDGFLDELDRITQPHPFDNHEVLYGSVGIDMSKFNGTIHLGNIVNYGDKGAGHGTKALHMLTNLADKYHVSISGVAKAYSNVDGHIQDTSELVKWYEKNGFLVTGGDKDYGFEIVYHPDEETNEDAGPSNIQIHSDPMGSKTFGFDLSHDYTSDYEDRQMHNQQNVGWTSNDVTIPHTDSATIIPEPSALPTPELPNNPVNKSKTYTPPSKPKPAPRYKFDKKLDDKVKKLLKRYDN